ncbi:hypothetical protein ACLB2K_035509 [Fragaria x ananassa]
MSMIDWFSSCLEFLSQDEFTLHMVIVWSVWKERICVYGKARLKKNWDVPLVQTWTPPPQGWLKENFDGDFDSVLGCGGVGIIIRNAQTAVIGGACFKVDHVNSLDMVEAMAGRAASEFVEEYQLMPVVFESNCLKFVKATKSQEMEDSGFGLIIKDIKQDLLVLISSFFSHVFKESNLVAHKVAKLALLSSVSFRWEGSSLLELQGLLASSCNR